MIIGIVRSTMSRWSYKPKKNIIEIVIIEMAALVRIQQLLMRALLVKSPV